MTPSAVLLMRPHRYHEDPTTLAHEAGHGLLHAHLFAFGSRPDSLFGAGLAADAPKTLCRDVPSADAKARRTTSSDRWWWG